MMGHPINVRCLSIMSIFIFSSDGFLFLTAPLVTFPMLVSSTCGTFLSSEQYSTHSTNKDDA